MREWAQNTKDAHGNRIIDSQWVQLNLARVHAKAEVLKLINWELASATDAAPSPADASVTAFVKVAPSSRLSCARTTRARARAPTLRR